MKVCGGAAFRKELGVERRFRDARAARVMAPTTDALLDFVGRAINGMAAAVSRPLLMGAVAYDPKVVTIWDGFRRWFADQDLDFDYVLYSHYERQVEDLVAGRIDAAWNSPLAWVRTRRLAPEARAVAMRDTDRDLTSVLVVPAASTVEQPADLAGGTVGTGAVDSPQGTLLPLGSARRRRADGPAFRGRGRPARRPHRRRARRRPGAGGRSGRRRLHARRQPPALQPGGHAAAGDTRVVAQTPPFDHCNMSVVGDHPLLERFVALLLGHGLRRPVGPAPNGPRGADPLAARTPDRLRRAGGGSRPARLLRRRGRGHRRWLPALKRPEPGAFPEVDLGPLGLDAGGHLLVDHALAGLRPGSRLRVVGGGPHLRAHLGPGPARVATGWRET